MRTLLHEPYAYPALPLGVYHAVDQSVETSPYQMIIRKADPSGQKFIISNFADLRIDVELQATEDAFDLVSQNLGEFEGSKNTLLSGYMDQMEEHEYTMTYRMREDHVEINRMLSVTFIGPCK
ncbi:MAG: hypothetical protein HKN87_16855 [Saprospiraceae bacterium]|nr:hypothetical protein [Saprospiraceae bacterium]